ncbi:type III secretion protein C [Sphingomonas guangdongensis]|uniref:Type 3 secretion system secretin n=1 Tax=Sphingomonas guangdongensis TaxID=1141890 RepID=A0A285QWU2_9SPHN|nr:type III secretion system outer membrane ring subunit SctC [Sphingomonas guangdongensis]SOB86445.1 type III secretion protein C [Sphingomonas guangdongensis]
MNRSLSLVLAGLLACAATPALAGEVPPFPVKSVSINARGQDVRAFLSDLFSQGGLRVKVSTAVSGKVNGVFVDTPEKIWTQMARAYGLVGFHDGGVTRVYAQSEIATRSIATPAAARVAGEVERLGLADGVNNVRTGGNAIIATGVPAFLERVEELAGSAVLKAPQSQAVAAVPAPAAGGAIASPLLRMPARGTVRSVVTVAAGRASPFEVRMFFLKYRDAADKELTSSDRITLVPGVATLLREQMGNGNGVSTASSNQYRISNIDRSQERGWGAGDPLGPTDLARGGTADLPPEVALLDPNAARISADPTNNAIIVRDRPERMGVYEQLIANLDTEPLMIEVEASIIEVNTSKFRELGVDWNLGINGLRLVFGGEVAGGQGAPNIGGQYISGSGDDFAVRIRALQQSGALRVVSRPVLSTPTNQVAVFDDTTQQFARITGEREVALKTITYGLSMRVQPSAIEDGGEMRIRMAIEIADTRLNGLVVDGIPLYSGPRISTQSIVKHGEAVLIAGMTTATQYDYKSKTPVLGDIPVVGQAFRKRNKGEAHYERLFLITPRIVSSRVTRANMQPAAAQPLSVEELRAGRRLASKRK